MSDEQQLDLSDVGIRGIEKAAGYEPMVPASPVDADPTPQDVADADSSAHRHFSRPAEADFGELVERPYLDVQTGEPTPENNVVTPEQGAHDLAAVRNAEKLAREELQNRDLSEALALLDTEQLVDRLAAQPVQPQPEDLAPQPEQADYAQAQATIAEADKRVAEFLADPYVRERLERDVIAPANAQVEQSRAAYQQATAELATQAQGVLTALFPELSNLSGQALQGALVFMQQSQPERFQQFAELSGRASQLVGVYRQQQAEAHARQRHRHAENLARFEEQEGKRYEALIARDRTPEQIKQIRENVYQVAERHYGIPQASMRDLYSGAAPVSGAEFMRSSAFQLMLSDAVAYRMSKESVGRAATRPVPNVQRPGISEPVRIDDGAVASALARLNKPGGAEGITGLKNAAALVAARRGGRG